MAEYWEELKGLWPFLVGCVTTALVLYGRPFLFRGRLFLPDYRATISVTKEPELLGYAMELPIRITNAGKKPITPISFLGERAGKAQPVKIPVDSEQRTPLGEQIESLHTVDCTLLFRGLNEETEGAITAIYLEDALGRKWYLPKNDYEAAREHIETARQEVMRTLCENYKRFEDQRPGVNDPVGSAGLEFKALDGSDSLSCIATNRTDSEITLAQCQVHGMRGNTYAVLEIIQMNEVPLAPGTPTKVSGPVRLAAEEWPSISALHFYNRQEEHFPVPRTEMSRLKERLKQP